MLNEANDKNLFNQIKENLTKEEILILKAIFFSILDGHKVSTKELSNQTKISFDAIDSILKRLDQQQLIVRERKGKIVGAVGLSLTKTSHKIKLNGHNYYCWCAADTIALPAALDADVEIKSRCGYDNNPIEITIRNGQLINVNPSSTTIWQVAFDPNRPLAGGTWTDINFFCSVEHAKLWNEKNKHLKGEILALEQAVSWGAEVKRNLLSNND